MLLWISILYLKQCSVLHCLVFNCLFLVLIVCCAKCDTVYGACSSFKCLKVFLPIFIASQFELQYLALVRFAIIQFFLYFLGLGSKYNCCSGIWISVLYLKQSTVLHCLFLDCILMVLIVDCAK